MTELETFKKLWLTSKTLDALARKWFENPSEIQSQVIPLLLANEKNIIWQAETWSGKTAAFGLPLIERLNTGKNIQALILVPTRELAIQVAQEISSLQSNFVLRITSIYGWQSYEIQNRALRKGVDILVGTPWRVMDHMNRWTIKLDNISYFILDEADEMLNMGFIDDIKKIFSKTNTSKRVLLFSATMPSAILSVVKKYMWECQLVSVTKPQMTVAQTEQIYFEVNEKDKLEALCRIMDHEQDFYGIVFCKTKANVDFLFNKLHERWYIVQALHGDIAQKQRENILKLFKNKKIKILIATDVAARWIDVNDMTHVINYNLPDDPEKYVHRVGRTGRAGKTWKAISFVTASECRKIVFFQKATKAVIKRTDIPEIKNVIENKQNKLKSKIDDVIQAWSSEKYLKFAQELTKTNESEKVIAALLKMAYQNELNEDNYRTIEKLHSKWWWSYDKWNTRLFITVGRTAWYTAKSLVEYLEKESWVFGKYMDDVRVMDNFSFATVPDAQATTILAAFASKKQDGRSLVSMAKDPISSSDRGSSYSRRRDDWPRWNYSSRDRKPYNKFSKPYGSDRWYSKPSWDRYSKPGSTFKSWWDRYSKPWWYNSPRQPYKGNKPDRFPR